MTSSDVDFGIEDALVDSKLRVIEWEHLNLWRFYPMAIASSWTIRCLLYPMSVVKSRLQLQKQKNMYKGMRHAFVEIVRQEGFTALYRVHAGITNSSLVSALAGAMASPVAQMVFVPTDIVAQHMMVHNQAQHFAGSSKNASVHAFLQGDGLSERRTLGLRVIRAIYHVDGLPGFYRYFTKTLNFPSLIRQQFSSSKNRPYENLFIDQALAGSTGGVMAAIMTNPLEMLRIRLQVHRTNYSETLRRLWKYERTAVFTKGLAPRILNNSLYSMLIMVGYETVKKTCVLPEYQHKVIWEVYRLVIKGALVRCLAAANNSLYGMLVCRGPLRVSARGNSARNKRFDTDAMLRANERSLTINENAVLRVDTCQVAANRPVEDFYSAAKCVSSSAHLFGVYDGHGGSHCSRYVSTRLFPYLCASVLQKHEEEEIPVEQRCEWLFSSTDQHIHLPSQLQGQHRDNIIKYYKEFIDHRKQLGTVRQSMQAAFMALDEDIAKEALPDLKAIDQQALLQYASEFSGHVDRLSALTAASGSCATVAHIRKRHLHIANIGDGAAVLGVSSANGGVSARQLGRAHCFDNADEVARIRAQHPVSEAQTIFVNGRLLGELLPLRAFGDVRYKWPRELQRVVLEPIGAPPPQHLHSPPYLTAVPEVLYHKLTVNDKFLVMATDGLWEFLDADTVVRLVHDHTLGTMTLTPFRPKSGVKLTNVLRDLQDRQRGEHKQPLDVNCATHIVRHALGGILGGQKEQYERLTKTLQLPPGAARSYRDDISVIVIHFDEAYVSLPCDEHEVQ